MAFIDDITDNLATTVANWLAPYQPNIPNLYPNPAPSAGVIPMTQVSAGQPIQVKVTTRLENKQCSVGIYDTGPEQIRPFISREVQGTDANGNALFETGRSRKKIVIEVWAYSRDTRRAIQNVIRASLGDVYAQNELDGSTTKLFYVDTIPFDKEQKDSIYVAQIHVMADFAVLQTYEAALVTSAKTYTEIQAAGETIFTEIQTTPAE